MRNTEIIMEKSDQPSKEKIRDWLKHRQLKHDPLPDIEQIQLELGWKPVEPRLVAEEGA